MQLQTTATGGSIGQNIMPILLQKRKIMGGACSFQMVKSTKMRPWNYATSSLNCRHNCINHKHMETPLLTINGNCRERSFLRNCNQKIRVKALQQPLGYPMFPRVNAMMVTEIRIIWISKTSLFALQCNILKKINEVLLLKYRRYQMKILCWNEPIWRYAKKRIVFKARLQNQQRSVQIFKA